MIVVFSGDSRTASKHAQRPGPSNPVALGLCESIATGGTIWCARVTRVHGAAPKWCYQRQQLLARDCGLRPLCWRWPQLWMLVVVRLSRLVGLLRLLATGRQRSEFGKDVELLVLRDQLVVLSPRRTTSVAVSSQSCFACGANLIASPSRSTPRRSP